MTLKDALLGRVVLAENETYDNLQKASLIAPLEAATVVQFIAKDTTTLNFDLEHVHLGPFGDVDMKVISGSVMVSTLNNDMVIQNILNP